LLEYFPSAYQMRPEILRESILCVGMSIVTHAIVKAADYQKA